MPTPSRGSTSPSRSGSPVQVLSVPENLPIIVRFLGPIRGLVVHWQGKRSVPCDGPSDCPSSRHKLPPIWKGYAAVEQWDKPSRLWIPFVLEVTGNLEELLRDRELRGETWTLFRICKKGKTDPVQGIYCERVAENKLSAAFDIVPILQRIYNQQTLRLDVPNFQAPKVFLDPVAGDAPKIPDELTRTTEEKPDPETLRSFREMMAQLRGGSSASQHQADDQAGDRHERNGSSSQGKNGQ